MMLKPWRFLLNKKLPPDSLKNVNFTVFGLGDSSYSQFNSMAKKLT
jgi:sulfite reductase alpha subunit-like flavoprotein